MFDLFQSLLHTLPAVLASLFQQGVLAAAALFRGQVGSNPNPYSPTPEP